jgi:hypothetical protein
MSFKSHDDDDDDDDDDGLYAVHLVPLALMEWKASLCTPICNLSLQYKFAFYASSTEV